MSKSLKTQLENAEKIERPEPLPLSRESAPAQPYPVKALGKVLAGAVHAIGDKVQCPEAIAAQSVLAAAALAVQSHVDVVHPATGDTRPRSEEHTSELQSLMRISYAVFCLKKKTHQNHHRTHTHH